MEPNNTLLTATEADIHADDIGEMIFSDLIGDSLENEASEKGDLFAIESLAKSRDYLNESISLNGSLFDQILRVFDSEINQFSTRNYTRKIDSFTPLDDAASELEFVAVSEFSNLNLDPNIAGSDSNITLTGDDLVIATLQSEEALGSAQLVRDIRPGRLASYASDLTEFNGQLYFIASDGITGRELWQSDGTSEGTRLLADIGPGSSNSLISDFTELNDQLFFIGRGGLWRSDGTSEGTQQLDVINANSLGELTAFNDQLFLAARVDGNIDGELGVELLITDGTSEGTQLININRGTLFYGGDGTLEFADYSGSYPSNFTEFNGQLFFSAKTDIQGNELWVSDGTSEGTRLVKDIDSFISFVPFRTPTYVAYGSNPSNFIELDGQLFFTANDGETGTELWVTDGTFNGTQLLMDINPSRVPFDLYGLALTRPVGSGISNLTTFNGQLFFTANDGVTGRELWISDGTSEGTEILVDINSGPTGSNASNFTEFKDQLFFAASSDAGRQLWVSNGTAEGTQPLLDISPSNLIVANDRLFFTANSPLNGQELWVSDGTIEGTQLFQDINPGSDSSDPQDLTVVGEKLFFTADNGINGRELWVVNLSQNTIAGDGDDNTFNGTAGSDLINGAGGDDIIRGRNGNDVISGGDDDDILFGGGDDDQLNGGAGNDRIFGGTGNDTLDGDSGNDRLAGGVGDDWLEDGAGDDFVTGGAGDDTVIVTIFGDDDTFDGGFGSDLIRFDPTDGRDLSVSVGGGFVGDRGVGGLVFRNFEQIVTGRGNDLLMGDRNANQLDGGEGNNTLVGGIGDDTLISNAAGIDTFRFGADLLDGVADTDTIENFGVEDQFDFSEYLAQGGTLSVVRETPDQLQISLSGEDRIHVMGTPASLDAAETQLEPLI